MSTNTIQKKRISWNECFMEMAKVISKRSPDPDRQVGAIIVDKNNIVLGTGYNAFPRGIEQTSSPSIIRWDKNKALWVAHAEENAIYNASRSVKGAKIYCTLFPCNECAKTIIQTGIKEIIYLEKKGRGLAEAAAELLLTKAKIICTEYTP